MTAGRFVVSCFVLLVLACQNGSVAPYAPCAPTDTCPSSTTCEASWSGGATFCTKSCASSKDCPSDGVCSLEVGPTATAAPFCYEACPTSGAPCLSGGGMCVSLVATDTSIVAVCLPGLTSPLNGTSWTSATIAPQAMNKGVATSTYVITLASGDFSPDTITVTGAFSATLTQIFSASSSYVYGGCTETTTLTGGTWTTTAEPSPTIGRITVTGATGTTNRTGCLNPA